MGRWRRGTHAGYPVLMTLASRSFLPASLALRRARASSGVMASVM